MHGGKPSGEHSDRKARPCLKEEEFTAVGLQHSAFRGVEHQGISPLALSGSGEFRQSEKCSLRASGFRFLYIQPDLHLLCAHL